jgi:uncharacterized protein DUF4407
VIKRIGDFLAWLGGADDTALKQVPAERMRFAQLAGVLLTTASIAALSMMFALHDGLKLPWTAAVIVGLGWGLVILNLDRFLVLSMSVTRDRWRLLLMAVPRLAIAAVLALVISTPLVLRIFSSDINARVYVMQLERSAQQKQLESASKEQRLANQLQRQINADQAILAGHLPVAGTSPALTAAQARVTSLQHQLEADQRTMNHDYEAWVCELYGRRCLGASGVPGNGNLAQIKQQQYNQAAAVVAADKRHLKSARVAENAAASQVTSNEKANLAQAQQRAQAELPGLRREYAKLAAFLRAEQTHGTQINQADTGILTQIQALYSIGAQDPALGYAHWAVFALFFMIEMLPVVVKILLNLAPMSAYDTVIKLEEDKLIDAARTRRAEWRRIEEGKSRTRISIEDDMRTKEEALGRQANNHVATEMTKILDIALQEWSQRVRARLSGGDQGPAAASGGQPGQPPVGGAPGQPGNGTPGGSGNGSAPARGAQTATSFILPDSSNL